MEQITIIGSNTLLGKHLVKLIEESTPTISLKLWNNDWSLYEALHHSDVVFNLHECQDFSLVPNTALLQKHNVEFVNELIEKCKLAGCKLLVHLSTTYLQCSTKWPNVWGRESEAFQQQYRRESPFPEYCESKFKAEQLIGYADQFTRIIARVGALYGEEDCHSLVCDAILGTNKIGFIPRISNPKRMGVFQFTYAANAADALFSCAQKMLANMEAEVETENGKPRKARPCETVLICDNTPLENFYSLLLEPVINNDDDGDTDKIEGGANIRLSKWRIPFPLFFYPYWLLCTVLWMFNQIFGIHWLIELPSPNYIYLLLRHWTFYSGYKLRIFFNWRAPCDWPTSLVRSRAYYRRLKADDVHTPSWLPQPNDNW